MTTDATVPTALQLRANLVDYIRRRRTFRTPQVEASFRAVPRHLFLPGVDLKAAYEPQVVVTKRAEDGTAISSASHPNLAAAARAGLAAAGYPQVEVICADGTGGYPGGAPYDRIIVTAGAWDLASAWWQQLVVGGRIVVPLRLHSSGLTRSIAFDLKQPGRMVSSSAQVIETMLLWLVNLRCALFRGAGC